MEAKEYQEETKTFVVDYLTVIESEAALLKLALHLLIFLFADFTFGVPRFYD